MPDYSSPAPVEPSAAIRQWASMTRQMWVALLAEGFTPEEAYAIWRTVAGH